MPSGGIENDIQLYSRKVYNTWLQSNVFSTRPLGQILMAADEDRNKGGKDVGIPGVISGNLSLTHADQIALATAESYSQDFQTNTSHNFKVLGEFDTEATYANPTTDASEFHFGTMQWRRTVTQSVITVWDSTLDAAKAKAGLDSASRGRAVLDVMGVAVKDGMANHDTQILTELYAGSPSNQSASRWNHPIGFYGVCHASNTYARLNRTKAGNIQMRGNRDATSRGASLRDLVINAQYTATLGNGQTGGLQALGRANKLKYALAPQAIFTQWINDAEGIGGQILLPGQTPMAKYGFTEQAIKYGNTIAMCDQNLNSTYVAILDPADFTVAFEKGKKMVLSDWKYLPKTAEGQQQRWSATITSSYFFICHNPVNPFLYTNVA